MLILHNSPSPSRPMAYGWMYGMMYWYVPVRTLRLLYAQTVVWLHRSPIHRPSTHIGSVMQDTERHRWTTWKAST